MATTISWIIELAGMALWFYGYFATGNPSLVDWAALTPWWIADFLPNIECEIGMVLVVAGETALLFTVSGPMPAEMAFGAIFLGPTAVAPVDPLHHLFVAGLGTFGARRAFRESAPLHPETGRAHELDRLGLRFVAIAVLHALLSLSGVVGRMLGR